MWMPLWICLQEKAHRSTGDRRDLTEKMTTTDDDDNGFGATAHCAPPVSPKVNYRIASRGGKRAQKTPNTTAPVFLQIGPEAEETR